MSWLWFHQNEMCEPTNWQLHVKGLYFPYPFPPLVSITARFKLYSMGVTKTLELEQGSYPNFVHGEVTPILTLKSCQLVFISSLRFAN